MNEATARGDLAATLLLDASVIDDPYAFYRRLVAEAPVWHVPDTEIVVVSSFDAVTEVVNRVDDFSSNLHAFLYRSTLGTPGLLPFEAGSRPWPLPTPRCTESIAARSSRSWSPVAWLRSGRTSRCSPRGTSGRRCRSRDSRRCALSPTRSRSGW